MSQETFQHIIDFIKDKKKILLMGHARIDADALGSVLSMYMILKQLGKQVTAVCSDPVPDVFRFLPTSDVLRDNLGGPDFIITLDCTKTPLDKLKYNLEGNKVNIVVTPKSGHFSEKDVSFDYGKAGQFDAIIVFDCGDLEHLGRLYENNVEMFYETPVINIDHHASNTHYGTLNYVNPVAASTTEILYEFIQTMEAHFKQKFITPDIATLLLAGVITDTGSFQHPNTSPKSMEIAAKLLDDGARQQEIIRHIYKTKKLSTLKLWGIVLSKIHVDPVYRMVWSTVSKSDLEEAEANSDEAGGILDDLLTNAPGAEVVFLIRETEQDYISVSLRTTSPQADSSKIAGLFGGGGHVQAAGFKIKDGRPLEAVTADILEKIRQFQAERLNINVASLNGASTEAVKPVTAAPAVMNHGPTKPTNAAAPKKVTYLDFSKTPTAMNRGPMKPAGAPTTPPMAGNEPMGEHKKRKRKRKHKRGGMSVEPPLPKSPVPPKAGLPLYQGGPLDHPAAPKMPPIPAIPVPATPPAAPTPPPTPVPAPEPKPTSPPPSVPTPPSPAASPTPAPAGRDEPRPSIPPQPTPPPPAPEIPDWLKQ